MIWYELFIIKFCSVRGVEERLRQLVLEVSIAYYTCEESTDVVRDEKHVADELALEVVKIHVVVHVCLAVGKKQEVCVVCTLLAADPHDPDENGVEVGEDHVLQVDDPEDKVNELDQGGYVGPLQSHGLERRERDNRAQVIGASEHDILACPEEGQPIARLQSFILLRLFIDLLLAIETIDEKQQVDDDHFQEVDEAQLENVLSGLPKYPMHGHFLDPSIVFHAVSVLIDIVNDHQAQVLLEALVQLHSAYRYSIGRAL